MASSRKIIAEFVGVFLIGALAGALLSWGVSDTSLTRLMSRWSNPDKLTARIDQKYAQQFHLTPEEIEQIRPLTHEMAQHLYQVRRQFGVDIIATLDTYHAQIAQKLTPEHRAAYEAAMADHRKELTTLLQMDQGSPEGGSK